MANPIDFVPIHLSCKDEQQGRKQMRDMLGTSWWRKRGPVSWAGFAAELAIVRAWDCKSTHSAARLSPDLSHDIELVHLCNQTDPKTKVEVKTRTVTTGWTNPAMFNYVTVPMHQDREPIKGVDLVMFNWYSASDPRRLWVLGYVRGLEEFKRRSVFYRGGDPLPRGGWAKGAGAYVIEVSQMRPLPRGMLKGDDQ